MMEKNSNDIKCEVCGKPATNTVNGHVYCDECKDSQQALDINEIQNAFKE